MNTEIRDLDDAELETVSGGDLLQWPRIGSWRRFGSRTRRL